jgi:hypothetical protein
MSDRHHSEHLHRARLAACELAASGAYSGWLAIESALRLLGQPLAREALADEVVRAQLDAACRAARQPAEGSPASTDLAALSPA